MDTSYLSSQVSSIIGQLHGLFDEIGVPNHDREARESELFAALSETLHNQVRLVNAEKNDMTEEAQRIITNIRQMEASIDDNKDRHEYEHEDENLKITFPLTRCLKGLKEKHQQISKIHRERFEQVKKLVQALVSYSSHLEQSFVKIHLPPTGPKDSVPPTFDLSPTYVAALDDEFTRVYEEYTRRVATVKSLSENIIQLWAELGTPQAQTDGAIVKYYRDSPEQLGLHEDDIARLRSKRDKLVREKDAREKRLQELKRTVEVLWDKLGVEEPERRRFLNGNRGCGVRQINEFEDELSRLSELKRQNLHLFVEDARYKLQELWDGLYFSEEEMLEFTPAFSDVYSDALLEAHEQEIERLEALTEQRAPTLALIDSHRSLIKDRDDLASASQDASRLMGRGQKGEKRDPTRLLREEKMRKRIAKDLPKIAVQLRKVLEKWEDEYGRPFLVHGERYLDALDASEPKPVPGPRAKTPAGQAPAAKKPAPPARPKSRNEQAPPARAPSRAGTVRSKTPVTAGGTMTRNQNFASSVSAAGKTSPSKLPSRPPLTNLNNSPERRPESRSREPEDNPTIRKMALSKGPPPRMRDLFIPPPPVQTPTIHRSQSIISTGSVRAVSPEDVYDDRYQQTTVRSSFHEERYQNMRRPQSHQDIQMNNDEDRYQNMRRPQSHQDIQMRSSIRVKENDRFAHSNPYQAPSSRQISNTSSSTNTTTTGTTVSGSENWETYDDVSEPEQDTSDAYFAKLRAARNGGKRYPPEDGYNPKGSIIAKKQKGFSPYGGQAGQVVTDADGNRITSGSEANWTDEDGY